MGYLSNTYHTLTQKLCPNFVGRLEKLGTVERPQDLDS
jgi:hypothetical protein